MDYAKNKTCTVTRVETAVVAGLVLASAVFLDYAVRSSGGAGYPSEEKILAPAVEVEVAAFIPDYPDQGGAAEFEAGSEGIPPVASVPYDLELEGAAMAELADAGQDMTPEMRHALEILARARERSAAAGAPEPDEEFFQRAAVQIGYVPAAKIRETGPFPDPLVQMDRQERISGEILFQSGELATVGGAAIRLKGVRAPAPQDLCETAAGDAFDCVEWSRRGMETIVAGRSVDCDPEGSDAGEAGVVLASCSLTLNNGSQRDLAEIGVEAGLLAPGGDAASRYRTAEMKARDAGNGLWSGLYQPEENGEK